MRFLPNQKIGSFQPYIGKEDDFQEAGAKYLDMLGVFYCHVANERKTTPAQGAKLKRKGVKPGVLDFLIFDQRKGFSGFAIELKVGKNSTTEEQDFWIAELQKRGWKTLVTKSLEEFVFEVNEYFSK